MPDAIFVGYKDYGWGTVTEPEIAFYKVEDAIKWKNEEPSKREFKLVEVR